MARMRITVTEDGPYLVSGGVPLVRLEIVTNDKGESVAWREIERLDAGERYQLCRCGRSAEKPYCDGTHSDVDFVGTETAGHESVLEQSVPIEGTGIKIHDARKLCAEARFCDRAGGLWNLVKQCDDAEVRALVEEEAMLCPSGRYSACSGAGDETLEFDYEPSIGLVEDPAMGVSGPLFVRGGVLIEGADGVAYEVRNRVTLCRCGQSHNKPFCDGSHIKAGFRDDA
jgi:CDGSH-type Zn-finger protein